MKKIQVPAIAWKVSKYGVFSGPYFPVFGPEKTPYLDTFRQWASVTYKPVTYKKVSIYLEKAWYRKARKATLAKTVAKSFAFHEVDDQLTHFYKNETAISDQLRYAKKLFGYFFPSYLPVINRIITQISRYILLALLDFQMFLTMRLIAKEKLKQFIFVSFTYLSNTIGTKSIWKLHFACWN